MIKTVNPPLSKSDHLYVVTSDRSSIRMLAACADEGANRKAETRMTGAVQ